MWTRRTESWSCPVVRIVRDRVNPVERGDRNENQFNRAIDPAFALCTRLHRIRLLDQPKTSLPSSCVTAPRLSVAVSASKRKQAAFSPLNLTDNGALTTHCRTRPTLRPRDHGRRSSSRPRPRPRLLTTCCQSSQNLSQSPARQCMPPALSCHCYTLPLYSRARLGVQLREAHDHRSPTVAAR